MSALPAAVNDGLVIAWRSLKRVPRIPELAIFAILQSILFVVLFAFVFGGAIPLPGGGSYRVLLPARVPQPVGDFLLAVRLMMAFTYSMAWVGVLLGLTAPTVETVQQLGFLIVFPLTFLSNAFVPTETLPDVLQPIAEWNPISVLTQATRELFGNPSPFPSGSFPGEHPIFMSLAWTVAILVVFAPLGVRKDRAIDR